MPKSIDLADCVVYADGIVYCSVCVPKTWTREQVVKAVNAVNPTGITSKWTISSDTRFHTGGPNPKPCEQEEGKIHYLMRC